MTSFSRIVLAARPKTVPTTAHFRLETAPMPVPGPGQFLARTIWLSLDPYMRGRMSAAKSYADPVAIGATMEGACVGEILTSNHPGFAPGEIVLAPLGWVSHGISDGKGTMKLDPKAAPLSTALGILGMPGLTAFVGLNDIAAAQPGETIVVSAATGAVGSLVGQLARLRGLRTIGIAGGVEKCRYAVAELGYDVCLDHHAADTVGLAARIAEAAPQGVDIYFENTGGKPLEATLPNLKTHARIAICGMIAWYSGAENAATAPLVWGAILRQRLRVQGFIIFDHYQRHPAFIAEVAPLVRNHGLKYRETVAESLARAPEAFIAMLTGGNFGKQLVRVGPDPL